MSEWRNTVINLLYPTEEERFLARDDQEGREREHIFQKYEELKTALETGEGLLGLPYTEKLTAQLVEKLGADIVAYVDAVAGQPKTTMRANTIPAHINLLLDLKPEVTALITVRVILANFGADLTILDLADEVSQHLWTERRFRDWDERQKQKGKPGKAWFCGVYGRTPSMKKLVELLGKHPAANKEWTNRKLRMQLGLFLVGMLAKVSAPDVFEIETVRVRGKSLSKLVLRQEHIEKVLNTTENPSWVMSPMNQPMSYPPLDWVDRG